LGRQRRAAMRRIASRVFRARRLAQQLGHSPFKAAYDTQTSAAKSFHKSSTSLLHSRASEWLVADEEIALG
jgi:hypothetical protein